LGSSTGFKALDCEVLGYFTVCDGTSSHLSSLGLIALGLRYPSGVKVRSRFWVSSHGGPHDLSALVAGYPQGFHALGCFTVCGGNESSLWHTCKWKWASRHMGSEKSQAYALLFKVLSCLRSLFDKPSRGGQGSTALTQRIFA
jgi:hypothetical protein